MPDIAIQIVNYKTKKYTAKCIEDVLRDLEGSSLDCKIVVLDNDSGDDLSDLEEKYRKNSRVAFYYSPRNVGFGAGHNLLSEKTEAKYLLLLNPDLEFPESQTVERLMKVMQETKAGAIGPKLVGKDGKAQMWDHGEKDGLRAWIANNTGNAFWQDRQERMEVAWVSGAVFLISREIFEKIGKFDENFFLYKEEEDLCLRLRESGEKILYVPEIKVNHHNSVVASKKKYMLASKAYYIQKHYKNPVARFLLMKLQRILWGKPQE